MPAPAPRSFTYQNKQLEVRATKMPDRWLIQIFEGERVASDTPYFVEYLTELDAKMQGSDWFISVDAFMATAQEDLEAGNSHLI